MGIKYVPIISYWGKYLFSTGCTILKLVKFLTIIHKFKYNTAAEGYKSSCKSTIGFQPRYPEVFGALLNLF